MSRTVFILGAGASAHCGTPLMHNFLEVAQDLMRLGEVEEVKDDFTSVLDAVGNLHAVQSKLNINTYNIEDVYAALEMGELLGSFPGFEPGDIRPLIESIRKVIGYTLERTTKLPHERDVGAPSSYYGLTDLVRKMLEADRHCSIMTFNYDLGLDYSFYRRGIRVDYGFENEDIPDRALPYLRLHGSLNWGVCSNHRCGAISFWNQFQYTQQIIGASYSIIPIMSNLRTLKCGKCGADINGNPVIVPPTWNKTAFHSQIGQVWKRAAAELNDAENIFVLGYSLPDTDMFFRYLMALGMDMKTILRGFYVYNPDSVVEDRFGALLSAGILQKFHYYKLGFEKAMEVHLSVMDSALGIGRTIHEILGIS